MIERQAICDKCGESFMTSSANKKRCSMACIKKYRSDWMNKKYIPAAPRHQNCLVCKTSFSTVGRTGQRTCSLICSEIRRRWRREGYNQKYRSAQAAWQRSEQRKKWLHEYRKSNMKKILAQQQEYRRKNPNVKLYHVLRSSLGRMIAKPGRTSSYVDFTLDQFRMHIEKRFKVGMSWENYGRKGWHIDHIKPLAAFNFFDEQGNVSIEEIRKAMSLENLQPLWAGENIRKSDSIALAVA